MAKMAEVNTCCAALSGIARDCAPSMGGVRRILVACYDDVKSREASLDKISTITMQSSKKFVEYTFKPDTAYLTKNLMKDPANGSTFVQSEIYMQLNRMDTKKRAEMNALAQNDLVMIVEDRNGAYWYLGYDEPVMATGGESGTGTARADANKYGITFQDNQRVFPFEVDPSIIPPLLEEAV